MKKRDLTNFLDSIAGSIEQKEINLFKSIIESSEITNFKDHEEFFHGVLYPFDQFIRGFVKSKIANNEDVVFIIKNQNYIEHNYARIIEQKEGSPCSADKSRTIIKCLLDYYKSGQEINFNYEQEYTYHLPKEVFKTHDHIIKFYEGLKHLWYGNNRKYLEALLIINESLKQ
ncbi:hypothetical protein [Tenacibaculum sp. C7A-26P2]|uniref:hypothetical protein n=1 Tax=Tenacibaculum sp. C7A-26P2 TaxID=3447504 RepID=UPI003F8709CE